MHGECLKKNVEDSLWRKAAGVTVGVPSLPPTEGSGRMANLVEPPPPWQSAAMSTPTLTPVDPKELRPLLHAEVDKLRDEQLGLAHRMLLEIELQQVTDELDDAADAARAAGRLTPESIAAAIAAHRAAHPYPR
jgi:hypothetical protein